MVSHVSRRTVIRAAPLCALLITLPDVRAAAGDRVVAVYQARPAGDQGVSSDALAALQQTIERRLGAYTVSDFRVQTQGADQIVVEMPMSAETPRVLALIGQVGLCEFVGSATQLPEGTIITTSLGGPESVGLNADGTRRDATATTPATTGDPVYQTVLQSADITDAAIQARRDYPGSISPTILLTISAGATQAFGDYTGTHTGQYISVAVDKRIVKSARLNGRIEGMAVLEGPNLDDLQTLVTFLRGGPLIVPLALIETHPA